MLSAVIVLCIPSAVAHFSYKSLNLSFYVDRYVVFTVTLPAISQVDEDLTPQERLARRSQQFKERQGMGSAQDMVKPSVSPITVPKRPVGESPAESPIAKEVSPLHRRVTTTKTTTTTTVILPSTPTSPPSSSKPRKSALSPEVERHAEEMTSTLVGAILSDDRTLLDLARERLKARRDASPAKPAPQPAAAPVKQESPPRAAVSDATAVQDQAKQRLREQREKLAAEEAALKKPVAKPAAKLESADSSPVTQSRTLPTGPRPAGGDSSAADIHSQAKLRLKEQREKLAAEEAAAKLTPAQAKPAPAKHAAVAESKPVPVSPPAQARTTSVSPRPAGGDVHDQAKQRLKEQREKLAAEEAKPAPVAQPKAQPVEPVKPAAMSPRSDSTSPRGNAKALPLGANAEEKASIMTGALVGAVMQGRAALELDLAKEKLRAERDKLIAEREERMAHFRAQQERFSNFRGEDVEDDMERVRQQYAASQQSTAAARELGRRKQEEQSERERYLMNAEFRTLKSAKDEPDTFRPRSPSPVPGSRQQATAAAAAKRIRDKKLALMKTMLKRQRLRMIIGKNNSAITKVTERLRRAIVKEHGIEGARTRARLGIPEPGDELILGGNYGVSNNDDEEHVPSPPSSKRDESSPRGRSAVRKDNSPSHGHVQFDIQSVPSNRRSNMASREGGARSLSPTRALGRDEVEIKPSMGAKVVIGGDIRGKLLY